MKLRIVVLIVLLSVGLTADGLASIAEPMSTAAISFTGPQVFTNNPASGGIGFEFTPTIDLIVNELGVFDDGGDGFISETGYFVGLYGSDLSYLASTTVSDIHELDETGFFRYSQISPLTLYAGSTYIILAGAGSDNYVVDAENPLTNGIDFTSAVYYNQTPEVGPLDLSNLSFEGTEYFSYFGPNFRYTAVPIPSGIWLLGSGLLFLVGRKKNSTFSS